MVDKDLARKNNKLKLQQVETLIARTVRAVACSPVDVSFRVGGVQIWDNKIKLPKLVEHASSKDIQLLRGQADSVALKQAYHNASMHLRLRPREEALQIGFDLLESLRVEIVGAQNYVGIAQNLNHVVEDHARQLLMTNKSMEKQKYLFEGLALYLREKLSNQPLPPTAKNFIEPLREQFDQEVSKLIPQLQKNLQNQRAFASDIYNIFVSMGLGNFVQKQQEIEEDGQEQKQDQNLMQQNLDQFEIDEIVPDLSEASHEAEAILPSPPGENLQEKDDNYEDSHHHNWGSMHQFGDAGGDYRIFTTQFDETMSVEKKYSDEELNRLRHILDDQLLNYRDLVTRLANQLQRRLLAQQARHWDFDQEEGYLDAARLSRVIINPLQRLLYKQERNVKFKDTVVTLLIDNSGSMRGKPIMMAAICVDILARTLERCGVAVEILGFTTKSWKGGQSREMWLEQNKPENPGRLNDVLHIIYKSADMPLRQARKNLGLMMMESILKENIDGEALLWAHQRLIKRPEQRCILMVISDGAPVDDATFSANQSTYLEKHLRHVISEIEEKSPVELLAIGIGHDVTRYYKQAVTILDTRELAQAMMSQLVKLLEKPYNIYRR